MRPIAGTDLEVFPLCLGGNVFGWTADRDGSFAVLDAYLDAGGNFVDTADAYAAWVDGEGGKSERIIGEWHHTRGNRDQLVLATKVAQKPSRRGLSAENIRLAADESLERLRTDRIDLYYAHVDDQTVPLEETLGAMSELVASGKVRYVGASNYSAARLSEALDVSEREGLVRFSALQPEYNLMTREFEADLAPLCARAGIGSMPYFGLAKGFLTGKYRTATGDADSPRAEQARGMLDGRGARVLDALDQVAGAHATSQGAVALAWLAAQPTVVAPLASARTPDQLSQLLPMSGIHLTPDELDLLATASTGT
jgi:aryl-alcohol dehydrogenase (NADP+)